MDFLSQVAMAIWAIYIVVWGLWAWRTRSPMKKSHSHWVRMCIFIPVIICVGILLAQGYKSDIVTGGNLPGGLIFPLTGLLLLLLGMGIAIWARYHLGRNWSSMPAIRVNHSITRSGPYRFVRHPIYAGLLLGLFGTMMVIGTVFMVIMVIIVFLVFVWKIRIEEQYLVEEFGDSYTRYSGEVAALIPFIF